MTHSRAIKRYRKQIRYNRIITVVISNHCIINKNIYIYVYVYCIYNIVVYIILSGAAMHAGIIIKYIIQKKRQKQQ